MKRQERVRGILIDSGKIVLIKRVKANNTYYVFPGGGVEEGESLIQALERELKEEVGIEVRAGDLLMQQRSDKPRIHQIEYFYHCTKVGGEIGTGDGPEYHEHNKYEGTHEVIETPLSSIEKINLLPAEMKDLILKKFVLQNG